MGFGVQRSTQNGRAAGMEQIRLHAVGKRASATLERKADTEVESESLVRDILIRGRVVDHCQRCERCGAQPLILQHLLLRNGK
jgi:hypothetical protein